ncbi:hypothetical protein LMOIWNZ_00089 [Enterococcus phage vB_OCPT_CCS3]|nr:hypothetical protein LMOIWNZ_00089 [Enterococcus phage vB_OCPT_CCS3]
MQEMTVERYNKPDIKLTFTKENDVFLATNYAGMTFTSEEARSLAEALQIMADEAEKKYVLVLPSGRGHGKTYGYTFLTTLTASVAVSSSPYEVIEQGSMTLEEVKRISPHYVPLAIPVEEFKQNEIGEF